MRIQKQVVNMNPYHIRSTSSPKYKSSIDNLILMHLMTPKSGRSPYRVTRPLPHANPQPAHCRVTTYLAPNTHDHESGNSTARLITQASHLSETSLQDVELRVERAGEDENREKHNLKDPRVHMNPRFNAL